MEVKGEPCESKAARYSQYLRQTLLGRPQGGQGHVKTPIGAADSDQLTLFLTRKPVSTHPAKPLTSVKTQWPTIWNTSRSQCTAPQAVVSSATRPPTTCAASATAIGTKGLRPRPRQRPRWPPRALEWCRPLQRQRSRWRWSPSPPRWPPRRSRLLLRRWPCRWSALPPLVGRERPSSSRRPRRRPSRPRRRRSDAMFATRSSDSSDLTADVATCFAPTIGTQTRTFVQLTTSRSDATAFGEKMKLLPLTS
mmetsp:Transcript_28361/g.84929  ORF Transcript_28361/g.84929 Transcript_28361/m.84929 type:complete len:251 (-) Transcript_28361:160-912(-)